MIFDLDLWPSDLNINRDHLIIMDYLPTTFEGCGAKRSRVISCTRWRRLAWPLTLTLDLLTGISIGIIYSSRTIYLPSLKLFGQNVLELSVAQDEVDWHDMLPRPTDLNIHRGYLLTTKIYLPSLKLLVQSVLELSIAQGEAKLTGKTFDLELWPSDLNINRDHLLIMDYLPTKFEAPGAKRSWVISCTRLRETDIPTEGPTDRQTDMCKTICPYFFEGGHK